MLYQLGRFHFEKPKIMISYFQDITPTRRDSIRTICLMLPISSGGDWTLPDGVYSTLVKLTALEDLTMKLDIAELVRRLPGRRFSQPRVRISGDYALETVLKAD